MKLEELFDYKNKLMKDICTSEEIVRLVKDRNTVTLPATDLIYTQIFPYEFVPETVDKAKTFICFDVDIINVPNSTYYYPALYIWVFTHKSNMRIGTGEFIDPESGETTVNDDPVLGCDGSILSGIRTDMIAAELDKILNGNRTYGLGTLDLYSVHRFSPSDEYLGRVLTYSAMDFNRDGRYKHPLPKNRKDGI